jgi:DNA polymerase (family 10)
MQNNRIADLLEEIADLLDLRDDNPFRIRSYRNAAQTVRGLSDSVETMVDEDRDLTELPNIGEGIDRRIHDIIRRGTCDQLEELREELPKSLVRVMNIPGVGPRTAMQLHRDLEVDSVEDLKKACSEHKVRQLDGMGEKTEQNILEGIRTLQSTQGRILLKAAVEHLDSLGNFLNKLDSINRWEAAGSFRRKRDTVGDLDILIRATDRKRAADDIETYEQIDSVDSRGDERLTVHLDSGLQIDFRFFEESDFGAALLYFTGAKAHNIELRKIAQDHDWKLNEYGLFKDENRLAGKTEEAVYHRLGLVWIPPELRENRGEIDAAKEGTLPELLSLDDIRGDLQCHTEASDGQNTIRDMAEAARDRGYDYLAITDHSKRVTMANGLDDDAALEHADRIRGVNDTLDDFWLLAGIEVDILKNGNLDLKHSTLEKLDWVVASIHYDRNQDRNKLTDRILAAVKSGVVHCIGHPLGRLIGQRDPLDIDLPRVFEACIEYGVRLEINAQPDRLDLPDNACREARDAGLGFTIGTDAHSCSGLDAMTFGVNVARRGWIGPDRVLNTRSAEQLRSELGAD